MVERADRSFFLLYKIARVQATFRARLPFPSPIAALSLLGAVQAADRSIALGLQRVAGQVVQGEMVQQLPFVQIDERMEFKDVALPFENP